MNTEKKISIEKIKNTLKVAVPPALVSTIILFINILFFGTNNIIIAPYMTLTFIRMRNYLTIEKNIIKPLFIHLIIGILSSIASESLYSTFIINLLGVGILAYFLTDEYNPSSYFPYLMAFVFLQLFPTSIEEIPKRLVAILISYIVVFIALIIFSPKGVCSKISTLIEDGINNISFQLKAILDGNEEELENKRFNLFEICKELNRFVYSSGKKRYYPFVIVFQHMNNIIDEIESNKNSVNFNENYLKNLRELFLVYNTFNRNKYINNIAEFISKNSFKDENTNFYIVYVLNYFISAIKGTMKPNKFNLKKYLNFKDSKEYFQKYSKYTLSLNGFKIRFAIRISILLSVSFTGIRLFNIPKGYWIPMTIFLLTLPFYEDSKTRVKLRFRGTIIGLIISFILFSIFKSNISHVIILIICTFFMYAFSDYGTMTIYITCYALAMTTIHMGDDEAIILRLIYTCISALSVLFANNFILPTKNHIELITMIDKLVELDEVIVDKIRSILDSSFNKCEIRDIIYSSYLISGKLQMHYSKVDNINFKNLLARNNQLTTLLTHCCIILCNEKNSELDKRYIYECLNNIDHILENMKINSPKKTILRDISCVNVNNLNHKNNYENTLLLKCLKKTSEVKEDLDNLKNDI